MIQRPIGAFQLQLDPASASRIVYAIDPLGKKKGTDWGKGEKKENKVGNEDDDEMR